MLKSYCHLTYADRCQIYALKKSGLSAAEIARQLGRSRSTVYRELRRNCGQRGYRHKQAQKMADKRRSVASSIPRKKRSEPL